MSGSTQSRTEIGIHPTASIEQCNTKLDGFDATDIEYHLQFRLA